jgi:hypothetical protein
MLTRSDVTADPGVDESMAFFKRSKRSSGPADGALTFMSESDAAEFRTIVEEVFAVLGLPVSVHEDHAIDAQGRQFGFWNIASQCATSEKSEWRSLIEEHLCRVLESMEAPSPFESLENDEAHYRTYARLYEESFVPDLAKYPHREFAPGIVEMLALDLPDTVAVFDHDNARSFSGYESLRRSGIANLNDLAVEALETLDAGGGATVHVLLGDSVYTGSRALLLPSLASELTHDTPTAHGWLMSIPNRQQVAWHVIKDAGVLHAVQAMARFTALGYADAPGPVSPHVYWWNGSAYEQLTRLDESGALTIEVSPAFQAVLQSVTREG